MHKQNQKTLFYLLLLFSCLLISYTSYRAYCVPMTHDESSTWLSLRHVGFWESLQQARYWTDANNHLLNTFLFQQSTALFGQCDWAVRLPNVLAHVLYLGASIFIVLQLTTRPIIGLAGWTIVNLNPYLLDFFSLARGYGLAMGFTMLSLAFFVHYLKRPRLVSVGWMFMAAGLSVLSNFTQFLFLAALWGVYMIVSWSLVIEKGGNTLKVSSPTSSRRQFLQWQIPPLLVFLLLAILVGRPIYWLQQYGEFEWGTSQLKDTIWHLVADSLYYQGYFSEYTIPVFCYVLSVLSLIIIGKGVIRCWRKGGNTLKAYPPLSNDLFFLISSLLLSGILLLMIAQKTIIGTAYLINRKALIFIPLWGLVVFGFCLTIFKNRPTFRTSICATVAIVSIWHFSRSMNYHQAREWWYEQHTLEMLQYLEEKHPSQTSLKLGFHWMFHPTITYYQETGQATFLQKQSYTKDFQLDKNYDYFYIFKEDFSSDWQSYYVIEKEYRDTYLLRRK